MSGYIIETRGLCKAYSGNLVLRDFDFTVRPGEVHCVVGENGAGKSTLIKLLTGAIAPTAGTLFFDGNQVDTMDPGLSLKLGIQVIYQENILAHSMSVAENIFMGREARSRHGWYSKKPAEKRALELMDELGVSLNPGHLISQLSSAERQYVKILKAMSSSIRVLIMDEPTSMFNASDSDKVLDIVLRIRNRGIAVIYISHHLQEIVRIADRVTVIRDGVKVNEYDNTGKDIVLSKITNDMVGRPVESFYEKTPHQIGGVAVQVRGVKLHRDQPEISFDVKSGEILGIAGMVGSGRTELARAVFGADKKVAGEVLVDGRPIATSNPRQAVRSGLAFITEDRQRQGLAQDMSVLENMLQVHFNRTRGLLFSRKKSLKLVTPLIKRLHVRGCQPSTQVRFLSGGNQQKVVLGKWLMVDSRFILFDEPTRGIDVNAKSEIYGIMTELAASGKSVLMISSDMPELIAMCDRILVMRGGRITGEIPKERISESEIIKKALEVNV